MNIDINDFVYEYKKIFNLGADRRYSRRELWKLRAYCYCAVYLFGFSINRTAKAIHKHHTTIMYHLRQMTRQDKINAEILKHKYMEIINDNKNR